MILEFQQGRLYDLVNDYCCQKWSIQQCCQGSLGGLECRVSCQSFPFTFASPSHSSAKNPRDMAIEGWVFSSVEEYWIKFVVPWAAVLVITHTKVRVLCGRTTKPSVGLWSSWEASLLSVLLSLHAHCFGESGDCWWCAWSCTLEQNCQILCCILWSIVMTTSSGMPYLAKRDFSAEISLEAVVVNLITSAPIFARDIRGVQWASEVPFWGVFFCTLLARFDKFLESCPGFPLTVSGCLRISWVVGISHRLP